MTSWPFGNSSHILIYTCALSLSSALLPDFSTLSSRGVFRAVFWHSRHHPAASAPGLGKLANLDDSGESHNPHQHLGQQVLIRMGTPQSRKKFAHLPQLAAAAHFRPPTCAVLLPTVMHHSMLVLPPFVSVHLLILHPSWCAVYFLIPTGPSGGIGPTPGGNWRAPSSRSFLSCCSRWYSITRLCLKCVIW